MNMFLRGSKLLTDKTLHEAIENDAKVITNKKVTIATDSQKGLTFYATCQLTDAPKDAAFEGTPSVLVLTLNVYGNFYYQFIFHDTNKIFFRTSWNGFSSSNQWVEIQTK